MIQTKLNGSNIKNLAHSVLLITVGVSASFAQPQQPIFKLKDDSLRFGQVQQSLKEFREKIYTSDVTGWEPKKTMDSLHAVYNDLLSRRLGWRYQYTSSPGFTSGEELLNGSISPDDVTRLSIAYYKGKKLPSEIMACTNLVVLEMVNTSVSKIQKRTNSLPSLVELHIYNNNPVRPLKLGKNNRITYLKIRGEKPAKLPGNFKNFRSLDSLDLCRNLMTEFPTIHHNKKLRQLDLSENNLTLENLPVRRNKNLETIFLRYNKIEIVPDEIGKFTELKKLTLNFNNVREIKPGCARLQKLEQLSLYRNRLEEIPDAVYKLTALREIDLYYNRIKEVKEEIGNLKNLSVLYLAFNEISTLPESIGELNNLSSLYIHNNQIRWLPESFGNLGHLKVLRMNNNGLMVFPNAALKLKALESLDVSYNSLYSIPTELPEHYPVLKRLAMVENPWENSEQILKLAHQFRLNGAIVHLNSFHGVVEIK